MRRLLPHICLCCAAAFLLLAVHTAWAQRVGRFRGMDKNEDGVVMADEFGMVCNYSGLGYFALAAGSDGEMTYEEYDAWLELVRAGTAPESGAWDRHFSCHP
ncbi:MAG: hypothetical protein ACOCWR_02265 [Oceanidesulfovibrio sp.]